MARVGKTIGYTLIYDNEINSVGRLQKNLILKYSKLLIMSLFSMQKDIMNGQDYGQHLP